MTKLRYIGRNNPNEVVNVKEKYVEDYVKSGMYEKVDDNVYKKKKKVTTKKKDSSSKEDSNNKKVEWDNDESGSSKK